MELARLVRAGPPKTPTPPPFAMTNSRRRVYSNEIGTSNYVHQLNTYLSTTTETSCSKLNINSLAHVSDKDNQPRHTA